MEDISTNHDRLTLMNHGGDCRTAPATPGLLIIPFNIGDVLSPRSVSNLFVLSIKEVMHTMTNQTR